MKLIGTMDDLYYKIISPNYVIEYGGKWYFGKSTIWREVGGIRQDTMIENTLYTAFCKYEFEIKAGQHTNLKHYTVKDVYEMYQEHLAKEDTTKSKRKWWYCFTCYFGSFGGKGDKL